MRAAGVVAPWTSTVPSRLLFSATLSTNECNTPQLAVTRHCPSLTHGPLHKTYQLIMQIQHRLNVLNTVWNLFTSDFLISFWDNFLENFFQPWVQLFEIITLWHATTSYLNTVSTLQKWHLVSITNQSVSALQRYNRWSFWEPHKTNNKFCGQNAHCLYVKTGGTHV